MSSKLPQEVNMNELGDFDKRYHDYTTPFRLDVMGVAVETPLYNYVEIVDQNLEYDNLKLDFIKSLDKYQEDSEFTEGLMKHFLREFVKFLLVAGVKKDDKEWYDATIEFLEAQLTILKQEV